MSRPARRARISTAVQPPSTAMIRRLDAALLAVSHFYSGPTFGQHMAVHGLTEPQVTTFRALRAVRDGDPPVSIRDVQGVVGLSHPATSRLIDRCVTEGFVERVESTVDRRLVSLTLTDAGARAAAQVEAARRAVVGLIVEPWQPTEVAKLVEVLERLGPELVRLRETAPPR